MPELKSRAVDSNGVIHVMNYQTVVGNWLTMCGVSLYFEESDYVLIAKTADDTEEPANCLCCLANEENWNEYGMRRPGNEWT